VRSGLRGGWRGYGDDNGDGSDSVLNMDVVLVLDDG
jgi:hypothetical protein